MQFSVMAGLVPPSTFLFLLVFEDVDARHKAGHDNSMIADPAAVYYLFLSF